MSECKMPLADKALTLRAAGLNWGRGEAKRLQAICLLGQQGGVVNFPPSPQATDLTICQQNHRGLTLSI